MKKLDLGQIVTLLANLGVIAGILLLVVEIRQNNELMADEAVRARAESIRQGYSIMVENSDLADLYTRERKGEELTEAEKFRLGNYFMRGLVGYQTAFQQLPIEELDAYKSWWRQQSQNHPSFNILWAEHRGTYQPDFVQFLEQEVLVGDVQ